jgi:hypothetical protein
MKYIIFTIFLLIQYLWDRNTSTCLTLKGEILLIIHHIIGVYIYLGGFLFNPKYHLILIIIVLVHWFTNNNRCELTILTNKYCGYNKEKKFEDLSYKLNLTGINKNIHYYYLIGLIIYDIYYLIK